MNQTIVTFEAKDFKSDNSARPTNLKLTDNTSLTGVLCTTLQLCVGAKESVITNLDVSDGLANGTQCIISDFWKPEIAEKKVITVLIVKLDDTNSGAQTRTKYPQIGRKYPDVNQSLEMKLHCILVVTIKDVKLIANSFLFDCPGLELLTIRRV
ncbi:hypothetical protein DPMN_173847 [Dreissena polymorpha]|uniref:Uncharacterized protein n=1 Tax=Dreissena polymorpha TaxID=45954 RepID=A0A9D4IHB4_DREPO|nr:hypothetical protein DPMN_173847 [Dreissena polymorpha]